MAKRIWESVRTRTDDGSVLRVARWAHRALPSYTDMRKKNKKKDKNHDNSEIGE